MVPENRSVFRSSVIYLVASYARDDSLLGPLLRRVPLNPTTRQLLSLERSEQRSYIETLWRFNAERKAADDQTANAPLYEGRMSFGVIRRFNQLPCTVGTRRNRAELLAGTDPTTQRVLVLGDDDLLSVELARRGFRHVTVADCDERLLGRIRSETAAMKTPPRIVQADFREGFASDEKMDSVFLDPPYSVDGALAFLRLAMTAASATGRIYMMINPGILGRTFGDITNVASQGGFRLVRHRPGFNAYPLGSVEALALKAAWRIVLGRPVPRRRKILFCSDCFEFERMP